MIDNDTVFAAFAFVSLGLGIWLVRRRTRPMRELTDQDKEGIRYWDQVVKNGAKGRSWWR